MEQNYWQTLQELLLTANIIIDRPQSLPHPRFPDLIFPLNYGYIGGTTSGDGAGIDVWLGSLNNRYITGILCTFDINKRDSEIKILVGCNQKDVELILKFTDAFMKILYIPKPPEKIMEKIPQSHADLLLDNSKAFAYFATTMKDGTPQVTPIWFNTEGDYILINSVAGRVKDKNIRSRPKVALVIADPKNPYRYIQVRGTVVEFTSDGAEHHIDVLNYKYHGNPNYTDHRPDKPRVIYKILPEKVQVMG